MGEDARAMLASALQQLKVGSVDGQARLLPAVEAAVSASPALVQDFTEQLEQQADSPDSSVAAWVCRLYALAADKSPSSELLASGFRAAQKLFPKPEAADSALEASSRILQAVYKEPRICFSGEPLWEGFHAMAGGVAKLFDAGPMHARIRAVKLMQDILLLLTSPGTAKGSPLGKPASQVTSQVQGYLKQLLGLLRVAKSGKQNSALTLAAIQTALNTCLKRPGQAGRLLPSLLALAAPNAADPSRASLQKCLRTGLVAIWGADFPGLTAWKPKIGAALGTLGIRVEGSPAKEKRPATDKAVHRTESSPMQSSAPEQSAQPLAGPNQQSSVAAPLLAPSHPAASLDLTRAAQEEASAQQSQSRTEQGAWPREAAAAEGADQTSEADIKQVVAIVAALLAENDQATCLAFVSGLPPAVLADVVLASMANLPSRDQLPQAEPQTADAQRNGNALLAGLMQATVAAEGEPQAQAPAHPEQPVSTTGSVSKTSKADERPAPPPPATAAEAGSSYALPNAHREKQEAAASGQGRKPPAAPKPTPPTIRLQPAQLTKAELEAGRRAALRRILAATARPCLQLRANILAHVSALVQDKEWTEAMAADIIGHKDQERYELALKWLCAVFAATSRPPPPATADSDEAPDGMEEDRRESPKAASSRAPQDVQISQAYESCLRSLLQACRDKLSAKDRTLTQLLVDAPALPPALLAEALSSLLAKGDEFATLALISARDIVLLRPKNRAQGLEAMLQMAVSREKDIRGKAVRLLANKLFPNIMLTADIERFATAQLWRLCQPPQQNGKRVRDREEERQPEEPSKRQRSDCSTREREGDVKEGAQLENGVAEPEPADVDTENGHRVALPNAVEKRKAQSPPAEPPAKKPSSGIAAAEEGKPAVTPESEQGESQEETSRLCALYCALCTKRHALLRDLFVVFGKARPPGRAAVLGNAEGLARVLGLSAPALLALVDDPPLGSESLLLKMLYFLTEGHPPTQVLAEACRRNFERTRDASFLPPALAGMSQEQIVPLLPRLLEPVSLFSISLARILLQLPSGEPSMTPTAVLLALHSIDPSKEGIRLKQVMGALDFCLTQRETFDKPVLASALQQLNQRSTLPPLYMRFLMQSQAAVPDLKSFTIEQLAALVNRQIWTNKTLFTGWNLAVRQNVPDSFPAFLQLPTRVLVEALQAAPADFQQKLKEYADSPACPSNQQKPIQRLFEMASAKESSVQ